MPYGAIEYEDTEPLVSLRRDAADAPRTQRRSVGAALVIVGTLALAALSMSPESLAHAAGRTMLASGNAIVGKQADAAADADECGDCTALCAKEKQFGEQLFAEVKSKKKKVAVTQADAAQPATTSAQTSASTHTHASKAETSVAATTEAFASPSAAPTSHYEDWTIYFTDGAEGESYVWCVG